LQDEQKQLPKRSRITVGKVSVEAFWIICGIVLPLAAIIVEKVTEICARSFFDPTPTDGHLLLISLIPLTNLIGELLKIPSFATRFAWLASPLHKWINGMAIGVAGFYTVWFLPIAIPCAVIVLVMTAAILGSLVILPIAAIGELFSQPHSAAHLFNANLKDSAMTLRRLFDGTFWMCLFLLPMTPFFSCLACFRTRSTLFSLTQPVVSDGSLRAGLRSIRRVFLPAACGLLALLAIEIPSTATRVAMNMAADPKTSAYGLLLLRGFGNEDSMLRMCYEHSSATDILGSIFTQTKPIPQSKAREIYYRSTGRPFNSRGIPASFRGKIREFYDWTDWAGADDVFDADAELAGETVGGVVRGVTLTRSEMTGVVDSSANAATINWDMEFNNESKYQREARAQILLPPHAVVSNVLLWINGQPRPAAFNSRAKTRAAYQGVVAKRRDPLLVTTYGPDRILAQCFPVPPNGTMHIQLGITAPLSVQSDNRAFLTMPIFLERNFQVGKHSIHLRADDQVSNPSQVLKPIRSGVLDGSVSNADLSQGKATLIVNHNPQTNWSWHRDSAENGKFIVQTIEAKKIEKPAQLVIVVDGSAALAEDAEKVAHALKNVPGGIKLTLLRAGDKVESLADGIPSSSEPAWANALSNLQCQTFVGGQDDTQSLTTAVGSLAGGPHSAILWLHGPQPVKIDDPGPLVDLLSRAGSNVRLYELQLKNGPNRTIEALDGIENVSRLPVVVSPWATLDQLFSTWNTNSVQYEPTFKQENLKLVSDESGESRIDLSPLWANEAISKLRQTDKREDIVAAVAIAKQYRVVTPVSGAVVLETQKDYEKYGLTPPSQKKEGGPTSVAQHDANQLVRENNAALKNPGLIAETEPDLEVSAAPEPRDWLLFLCALLCMWFAIRNRWLPAMQDEH
jgi:hypothetical protein